MNKKDDKVFKVDRRSFLKVGSLGLGGIMIGIPIACTDKKKFLIGENEANFSPNVYMSIDNLGEVTLIAHRSEMGTGIRTSLPLVMADELEADWNKVKIVQGIGDAKYGDQNTDGSYSVRMFYQPLRKVAATMRHMLEQAAANEWGVDISECHAINHKVEHDSGKSFGFGYLAEKAALLELPEESLIELKSPEDFRYISKKTSIYDLEDIVTGKAIFGYDKNIEGAKIAMIARNPQPGGGINSYNKAEVEKIPGIIKIYEMEASGFPVPFESPLGGVVIVADNTWAALKAKAALKIDWADGSHPDYNTSDYINELLTRTRGKGIVKREKGNVEAAIKSSSKTLIGEYTIPHSAHAPMETPCAVASAKEDGTIEIWAPVQDPQWTTGAVENYAGFEKGKVIVNVTLLGGAFGRKSKPEFVVEAARISKEMKCPIKVLWTREDDIALDFFHTISAQRIEVGIDDNNKVSSWNHRSIFSPIGGTPSANNKIGSDFELGMGAIELPFDIDNICVETNEAETKIRVGWMRSVVNIPQEFAVGSMVDEIAVARNMDPIDNFLDLLGKDRLVEYPGSKVGEIFNYNESRLDFPFDTGRFRKVVETLKEKSGWGKTMGEGRGIGFCAHRSFLTYVACVVEVEITDNGDVTIPVVHYAVDCGVPVNPERIKAQFEGGAVFGINLALLSEITVKDGVVEQDNFDGYQIAKISQAPKETHVYIIDSNEKPTGVGEPPVPPVIPAICNAIYNATGIRIRHLPYYKNKKQII